MTARYQTAEPLAREAAAFDLVGRVSALLKMAKRDDNGDVILRLGPRGLAAFVDNFNRATSGDPIAVDDVGR